MPQGSIGREEDFLEQIPLLVNSFTTPSPSLMLRSLSFQTSPGCFDVAVLLRRVRALLTVHFYNS